MIRVLVADDQNLVRAGFRVLIESEPDLEVVGEAADGREAYELALRHRPDVVLMDIRMPGADGLAATRSIGDDPALDAVRVVILTTCTVALLVAFARRFDSRYFCHCWAGTEGESGSD